MYIMYVNERRIKLLIDSISILLSQLTSDQCDLSFLSQLAKVAHLVSYRLYCIFASATNDS